MTQEKAGAVAWMIDGPDGYRALTFCSPHTAEGAWDGFTITPLYAQMSETRSNFTLPEAPRGTDAQILKERELTIEAINGAMAFGEMGKNPPPEPDHWLAPFWRIGRKLAEFPAEPMTMPTNDELKDCLRLVHWHSSHYELYWKDVLDFFIKKNRLTIKERHDLPSQGNMAVITINKAPK